ncbi:hypothetical protein TNCV_1460661 [Trichonephila clavipes]|nr:hypothetical protein TNCV_1460661 [Trichonephila clavipes]
MGRIDLLLQMSLEEKVQSISGSSLNEYLQISSPLYQLFGSRILDEALLQWISYEKACRDVGQIGGKWAKTHIAHQGILGHRKVSPEKFRVSMRQIARDMGISDRSVR